MKPLLSIVAIIAFYFGVNYMALSQGAIIRWTQKTQFPNIENAELFCSMLTPETQIQYTYTINGRSTKNIAPTSNALCEHFKQTTIPNAKRHTHYMTEEIISHERTDKMPFNRAKSTIQTKVNKHIIRKFEIELRRTTLGDFKVISIKGHDEITKEEKPKVRR